MADKISSKSKSASISTIPDAEITIPDAKLNTWYKDGKRRWRVLERETNMEQIDLIPSRILPSPIKEIPSQAEDDLPLSENPGNAKKLEEGAIGDGKLGGSEGSQATLSPSIGDPKNENESEKGADSHGKSGGSLKSQPGNLKEGSVGHGKSGGSQGSGQNGSQTNENKGEEDIYENPDANSNGKSGGSEGSGQNGSQTSEDNDEKPIEGLFRPKNQGAASNEYPEGQSEERLSLSEDSGNATKLKEGAGRKKKSGFWNCCSGGSTGSGSYTEDKSEAEENLYSTQNPGNPQMGGEDGSSSLDKSGADILSKGATDESRSLPGSLGAGSQGKFGLPRLYERSRSLTGSLSNQMTTGGLESAKTLAENAGCLRGMEISMECGSLPYRERREVHWIEQINNAKEEIQACLPLSEAQADQDGSNLGFSDMISNLGFSDVIPYAIGGTLLLLAIGVALYLHLIGITDMNSD